MPISSMPSFVVQAKLHPPRGVSGLVSLTRAQQSLAHDIDRPFTLISAPAGFGKTTLLSEWLRVTPRPGAWVTLDEHDNDLATFLTYLVAAVRTLFPNACPETNALLQLPNPPPLSAVCSTLNNEIDSLAEVGKLATGQRFILVLDDYHRINDQAVHQIINELLLHSPRPLHLAIGARYDPPLSLHTLRARGDLVEIRSSTLRFTGAEVATFLQKTLLAPIDETTITQVEKVTEGWVAGLRFAALALNTEDGRSPLFLSGEIEHRFATDYLTLEVLTRLPAAMQLFLMQTALLDRLNGALCDAVIEEHTRTESSQQRLKWLENEGVFTISLGDQGEWYRYHSLFQRLLREQLARRYSAEQIAALHRRASAWYAANDLVEDALHHALAAGDATDAAQIIETHRHRALNFSQFQRLEQWMKLLPPSLIEARPGLLIIEAWLLAERWRTADMNALLDHIETLLPDATLAAVELTILESEIAALRSDYCYFIGDRTGLLHFSRHALEIAPMTLSSVRRFAWLNYLAALQLHGDLKALQDALHISLREDRIHGDAFPVSPLITHCAASWMNADLTTLQQSAAHLLRLTQERNLLNEQGWAHLYLGCVAYQQNNLESAFQAFSTIVNRPYNTHGHAFWQAAFGLAAVLCAQGACERAQTLNDSLRATAWEMGGANVQEEADALTAFVALQRGQLVTTQRWAATYDRGQPIAPISMFYAPSLVLARILVDHATAQEHTRAQEWLQHLYEFSLATYNVRVQIEILALQAILHEVRGERAAALARLDNALQLAAPGGLVRVFIDLGAPLAPLLAELEGRESAPTLVRKILQSWPSLSEPIKPPHPALGRLLTPAADGGKNDHNSFNSEPLTRREQEVLALLAQRLTAEEVAQRLVISENTVKRHRTNIYQKLGVNRLRDALAIAGATGMLES
jgi:LuxR family maltose regulon positive regulatory protein